MTDKHETRAREIVDEISDRAIADLQEGRKQGTFCGDEYDTPNDCEVCVPMTMGEVRTLASALKEQQETIERAQQVVRWFDRYAEELPANTRGALGCVIEPLRATLSGKTTE
jgi:hypothetical protein